jgi:hypothetical protein
MKVKAFDLVLGLLLGVACQIHAESRFDELANLPSSENRPTAETATALRDELLFQDPNLKSAMTQVAVEAEEQLIKPLFQFRNYGQQLPHHWSTVSNEASFGADYFTRTAVAKSNIFVNSPKDGTPPVNGFWSLSIYNEHHFFVANSINRFSVGTKKGPEDRRRRLSNDLRAGRCPDRSPAAPQLAPGAQRRFLSLRSRLLAEGRCHRRHVDASGCRESEVVQ